MVASEKNISLGPTPFERTTYKRGQELDFEFKSIDPSGQFCARPMSLEVDRVVGTGFFGSVILPKDKGVVLKMPTPKSRFKEALRYANHGMHEFPDRVFELAAAVNYLNAEIIHRVIPVVSDGVFYTPKPLGYTHLDGGYTQVLEEVSGRGPKYDRNGVGDLPGFKEKQKELKELEYRFGIEQGAQVADDNPAGLPNLWWDEVNNRYIQVDIHPAFLLKPTLGVIRFGFHEDARRRFYPSGEDSGKVPFNRIHTNILRAELLKERGKFSASDYADLLGYLKIYDELRQQYDSECKTPLALKEATKTAVLGAVEVAKSPILGVSSKIQMAYDSIRIGGLRQLQRGIIYSGVGAAHNNNQISDLEYNKILVESSDSKVTQAVAKSGVLALGYEAVGAGIKVFEYGAYAQIGISLAIESAEDLFNLLQFFPDVAPIFLGARFAGSAVRPTLTLLAGAVTGIDMKRAAKISAIPYVGDKVAPLAQFRQDMGHASEEIVHYSLRNLSAKVSSLHPLGGWGTDQEAWVWQHGGKWLERLVR